MGKSDVLGALYHNDPLPSIPTGPQHLHCCRHLIQSMEDVLLDLDIVVDDALQHLLCFFL